MTPSQSSPGQPSGLSAEAIRIGVLNTQVGFLKQYGVTTIQGLKLGIEYATEDTWQVAGRPRRTTSPARTGTAISFAPQRRRRRW